METTPQTTEAAMREEEIRETEANVQYERAYLDGRLKELKAEVQQLIDKHTANLHKFQYKLEQLKYNNNKYYALRSGKYITIEKDSIHN